MSRPGRWRAVEWEGLPCCGGALRLDRWDTARLATRRFREITYWKALVGWSPTPQLLLVQQIYGEPGRYGSLRIGNENYDFTFAAVPESRSGRSEGQRWGL